MALSGIPIDPQQCIGDSLIVLNVSFSELDSRTLSLSSDIASSNSNLTSTIQSVSSNLNSSISLTSSNLYSLIQTTNSSLTGLTQVVGASSGNLTSTIQAVSSNLYTIIQSTSSTQTVPVKFSYTGNDLLSSFALTGTNLSVSPISYRVTVNGVVQDPSVDFNISGSDLVFTSVPPSGVKIVVVTAENYANTTVSGNYLPLAGGTVTGQTQFNGNVTVYGDLSATGNSYFANTFYSTTSALSVINIGNTGPALYVGNNGTGDIASFYDLDAGVEVLHVGGSNGTFPNVGIKTSTPNEALTVNGNVSASGSILSYNDGSSSLWKLEDLMLACSDESTNLTTSTSAVTFRVPFAMYLNSVKASVNVAPVGSTIIVDVRQNGSSIFSTLLSIDANEETSTTAAVPAVISNRNLTDDAKIVVSINQVGSSTAGRGLKLNFKGYRI